MEENEDRKFYLTYFLLITGFCFLLFALMLTMVDGKDTRLFWWIGGSSFVLGIISGADALMSKAKKKDKIVS